jgi:hypothetical protein
MYREKETVTKVHHCMPPLQNCAKFAMPRCTRVPRDVDASVVDASREADRANSSIRTTLLDGGTVLLLQH